MDLTQFTSSKKTKEKELLNTNNTTITTDETTTTITFKTPKDIEKELSFFSLSTSLITDNQKEAENFFQNAIHKDKVEGVMAKSLTSPYSSGLRTGAMAKIKETKEDIDVVITKAELGKGKRAGFYSSFYVAVKNEESLDEEDELVEIGKVSSGIKELEEQTQGISMQEITKLLEPLKIKQENNIVYFEPKIILQIRYQEIQKSPTYSSGIALRFPRIILLRKDKDLHEINSLQDILKWNQQIE
jgi:DNA ligase-1